MKITKKEFDSLYTDTITKKDHDTIIKKIENRVGEIVIALGSLSHNQWFDFGNCNYNSEISGGYFNFTKYKETIELGGEWPGFPEPFEYYFPTKWLWDDNFKEKFNKSIQKHLKSVKAKKAKLKNKKEELKAKKAKLHKSIKSKLTAEELKAIKFK